MRAFVLPAMVSWLGIALAGCGRESTPGGPGAAPRTVDRSYRSPNQPLMTESRDLDQPVDSAQTFTIETPGATELKRGEREEVTLSIDRGSKFDQAVKIEFQPPNGLTVIPSQAMIQPGEAKLQVVIEAAADAPGGDANIQVVATPETGRATKVSLRVEVDVD